MGAIIDYFGCTLDVSHLYSGASVLFLGLILVVEMGVTDPFALSVLVHLDW